MREDARRLLELGWPTGLVGAAGIGLAAANWLALPTGPALVVLVLGGAVAVAANGVWRLAALALVLVALGLACGTLRLEALGRSALSDHLGERAPARAVVTGPARKSRFTVRVPARTTSFGRLDVRERVMLELPPGRAPPQGAEIELETARPVAPRGPETGFDERGWLDRLGVHVVLEASGWRVVGRRGGIGGVADRLRAHVAGTLARIGDGERHAVLVGVVLGADEGLDDELQDAFRASGLYHLLAVSGQNVALIAGGIMGLAWLVGLGRLPAQALTIASILAYALAVGWQPSVVRASVAGCLVSLAWLTARPRDRWHFLAVGALVLLAWTPRSLLDPGFQLSFAAVAAIFVALPWLESRSDGLQALQRLVQLIGVAAICGAATAPLVWAHFGAVPAWTVPANALAEPAMPALLGLGLAAAVVEPLSPSTALALAWLAGWCAAWLAFVARSVSALPYAQLTSGTTLLVIGGLLLATALLVRVPAWRRRRILLLTGAAVALGCAAWWALHPPPQRHPPAGLRVTFLDVGQGDAALVEAPTGSILVDQGPPEADVAGRLTGLGIRALAAIVLTHPQRDHIGGAPAVLEHLQVGSLLYPALAQGGPEERAALAIARRRGVRIVVARAGLVLALGQLRLSVLSPDDAGFPGDDPNTGAVVMLVSYGQADVLLTADAESDVLSTLPLRPVEALKISHHGSDDPGLPALLRVLRPRVAVVSVGAGNRYGHPTPETMATLSGQRGLRVFHTDRDGDVVVQADGRTLGAAAGG